MDDWTEYYVKRTQDVMDGTWKSQSIWWGLKEGMVKMAPYGPDVRDNVRAAAEATRDSIIAGSLHPFTGPIKDTAGAVRVAAGETMSDGDVQKMDWYVEGVEA